MARPAIKMEFPELTQDIVRELIDYNPHTGLFIWKWRDIDWFDPDGWNGGGTRGALRAQCSWNGRHANKPAFCTLRDETRTRTVNKYFNGALFYKSYFAHRIAFMWMTGRWPHEIDHINGDGTDNRWKNLREVTREENMQNRRRQRTHNRKPLEFKYHGIKWNSGRYGARISVNKKHIWLGTFDTLAEAIAVRKEAERKYGFTERHGKD